MRVTKTVREFIEKKIEEKYPLPEYPRAAIQQEQSRLDSIQQTIENELSALYLQKLKDANVPLPEELHHIRFYSRGMTIDNIDMSLWINKFDEKHRKEYEAVSHKRAQARTNIILTLELGGTKDELMSMLENLPD